MDSNKKQDEWKAPLHSGEPGLGVLAWDFQRELVANKLKELGGIPQIHR